jgi:hypothetical protein
MRASTALRIALMGEIVLAVIAIALSLLLSSTLPPELQAWLERETEPGLSAREIAAYGGYVVALALWVGGLVGLLMLRRWGAWLYLAATTVGYLSIIVHAEPVVEVPVADIVAELATILCGVVLGLSFFSDALKPAAKPTLPPAGSQSR